MLRASAFVPGHVTGFFEIRDNAKKKRHRGSRGVGICLSRGVHTVVGITSSKTQSIDVLIDNKTAQAPVTKHVVKRILGNELLKVKISSTLELPQGQGFGMSGAGALSASLALAKALELEISRDEIVCMAHEAEIEYSTGLGDVVPQSVGGMVIRKMEGCPPFGMIDQISPENTDIVCCVIGEQLPTKTIITNEEYKKRINEDGKRCLQELLKNPTQEKMMHLSFEFSKNTGLLSGELEDAIAAVKKYGQASMSMLGNSIFAMGDTGIMAKILKDFGEVYICKMDSEGARVVKGR
ncbi:MAG: hypothetical protein JSV56_10910 [Methanomassiliicoccales archaeon]|nr:MAG: hypothetical protein JSV56_10910 [Methanomassiliicoccales archaeon]